MNDVHTFPNEIWTIIALKSTDFYTYVQICSLSRSVRKYMTNDNILTIMLNNLVVKVNESILKRKYNRIRKRLLNVMVDLNILVLTKFDNAINLYVDCKGNVPFICDGFGISKNTKILHLYAYPWMYNNIYGPKSILIFADNYSEGNLDNTSMVMSFIKKNMGIRKVILDSISGDISEYNNYSNIKEL